MIISIPDEVNWRTMTALRESIKFYKERNIDGKYDKALRKEQSMLKDRLNVIYAANDNLANMAEVA